MSESSTNTPPGDDLPMKWKLLGMLIFMRPFYKVAGLVVEAPPVGETTINTIRDGRHLGPTQPRECQPHRPKLAALGSQPREPSR
jgi:hypothetical protein